MNSVFQDFYRGFGSFIGAHKKGRGVLFTCLFYSFWLVVSLIQSQEFELDSLPGRMLGTATLDNYDIGARVSLFYKSAVLFFLSFLFFNLLAYFLFLKKPDILISSETRLINHVSLAGLVLLLFQVYDFRVFETLELVYFIHKIIPAALLLRLLLFKRAQLSIYHYSISLIFSASLFFCILDLFSLSGSSKTFDFYIVCGIVSLILIIGLNVSFLKSDYRSNPFKMRRWLYCSAPLVALPFLSVLKDEIFLVLKSNGYSMSRLSIWLLLYVILILTVWFRFYRNKKRLYESEEKILALRFFPFFIFSIITYLFYRPQIEYYREMFESANTYLPIMEYKLFGLIPTLEKFNSHLVSDYFFSSIYTAFNGMALVEIELYDFLLIPVSFLLYYYLLYFLSGNAFISLFSVLFFPFCFVLFPDGYCFGVIGLMAVHKVLNSRASLKNYLLLFTALSFLVIWRSDLGLGCTMTIPIIILLYHFLDPSFRINWSYLFKSLMMVLGSVLILLLAVSLYRGVNIFNKLFHALHFLSSAQTFGYIRLGESGSSFYKMHYFVFPALVCILILVLFLKFKSLNRTKGQRLACLSLVFISIYYLSSFNRGLVRHSLMEVTDTFTSEYIYLILPGCIFVFFRNLGQSLRYLLFILIAFFLITNYKVPQLTDYSSLFERNIRKLKMPDTLGVEKISGRVKNNVPLKKDEAWPFIDFISKNTKSDETYIDVTGNGMLYFYAQKETPSYFYQNPLCNHNDVLQKVFIDDLKNYKTPYMLFATIDERGYNEVDGVPNSLRQYRMFEYFYHHYSPYISIGRYCIWKKNGVRNNNRIDTLFRLSEDSAKYSEGVSIIPVVARPGKKHFIKIAVKERSRIDLIVVSGGKTSPLPLTYLTDTLLYAIPEITGNCELQLKDPDHKVKELFVISADYIPEFYSQKFLWHDLRKLPYVWGNHDKELAGEAVLFKDSSKVLLSSNTPQVYNIPLSLDKNTGNTVILRCLNKSTKIKKVHLRFGNSGVRDKSLVMFDILPSGKEQDYAIRVSSMYKWYADKVNCLSIQAEADKEILISRLTITKGN